jgi:hypothetical protein
VDSIRSAAASDLPAAAEAPWEGPALRAAWSMHAATVVLRELDQPGAHETPDPSRIQSGFATMSATTRGLDGSGPALRPTRSDDSRPSGTPTAGAAHGARPMAALPAELRSDGMTGRAANGGDIAEGGFTTREARRVRAALERMWRDATAAQRAGVPVRNRGPPEAGLREDEELFVPRLADIVEQLRRDGLTTESAADLARRIVEFPWRDPASGIGVIVVPAHRLAELQRTGLLGDAVEHPRRFHLDPNALHDEEAHAADARRIVERLGGRPAPEREPGPVRAAARALAERVVQRRGRVLVREEANRAEFRADPHAYARTQDWVRRVVGEVLEELARPVLAEVAANRGERLLKNVVV